MTLRRRALLLSAAIFCLSACSVYKSTGRKNFESKAPDNIRESGRSGKPQPAEAPDMTNSEATCWNQPAKDPLWHVDTNYFLSVSPLSDDEIQVCIQDS